MQRIDHPTAAVALPAPGAPGAPGYFAEAPPGGPGVPTVVTAEWANGIQEELAGLIEYAGLVPDKNNLSQVLAAILSLQDAAGVNGAGSIFGLTLSNAIGFLTSRITITAGLTRDSTNTAKLALGAPLTKRLDQVWAVGNNNGGRDSAGALANGQTWHVFAILRPDTGVVDALFSQSPTAPTLPASYTKFRRLGAIILEAASTDIRQFSQNGDWFMLKTRSADFAAQANGGGVPYLRQITVPQGIPVEARVYFQSTGTADLFLSGVFDPAFGVPPAFGGATQWAQIRRIAFRNTGSGADISYGTVVANVFTDAARQIYTFSSDTAGDVIALGVLGWRDERGKFF